MAEKQAATSPTTRGRWTQPSVRDPSPSDLPEPEGVEIVELARGEGKAFGRIAAKGFDLQPWAAALFRDLPGREGWRCYAAEIEASSWKPENAQPTAPQPATATSSRPASRRPTSAPTGGGLGTEPGADVGRVVLGREDGIEDSCHSASLGDEGEATVVADTVCLKRR